jgi:hypothetical protein
LVMGSKIPLHVRESMHLKLVISLGIEPNLSCRFVGVTY